MPGTNLTREEAATRADLVRVDRYDIVLDLTRGPRSFATTTTVHFDAREGAATFLDFVGDSVQEVVLNGRPLDAATAYADSRIALDGLAEHNEVVVRATGLYTNTGEGLHRFVDPVDDEVYLYSQFEVADARRVFAVFEQPDLKATFSWTATVPSHWQVVSVSLTPEPSETFDADGVAARTWTFEPTPRLSPYINALVAGPYDVVRDEARSRKGAVPLAIYARKSLMAARRRRQHLLADQARLRVLREGVRLGVPVRQVRPDLHARSTTPARWRTPAA